ncbi:lysophospholipid acyltransferase family protein [Tropicimonas sp. IMCC34011]|uniref:lysophospholipid acyltransferase family protein n=1 Tax=Tropicimonas sp. IMCC34011 TaxID=2248759 RepID=UPI000E230220|nr:lauroyl acyltransferase [Tropicimonas sp. IMCC34011]
MSEEEEPLTGSVKDRAVDAVLRAAIWAARRLPYETRVPLFGTLSRRVFTPLAGYDARIAENLDYVFPDMPPAERRRIAAEVADNAGRMLIENYSAPELLKRAAKIDPEGPGMAALMEAKAAGRPVIVISGHFGNYEAARGCLNGRGLALGGLYRPMANAFFNAHYVRTMENVGKPMFASDRTGMKGLIRHLSQGGRTMLLNDLYIGSGRELEFLGRPAMTAVSAAEMATRYDALFVPAFAIRQPDGINFRVIVEEPIPDGDPESRMQEFNARLEAMVRAYPGQWFWIHRRWKLKWGKGKGPGARPGLHPAALPQRKRRN